jgi:hypothetical protein
MRNRAPKTSGIRTFLTVLPAFIISAVLATAFLGIVHKTHNLFEGGCPATHQSTWHLARTLAQRAIGVARS